MSDPAVTSPPADPLWRRRWTAPAVISAVFVTLFTWTWQTWPDVLVDFGVQLYVPWQITQGKVLYRDIAHYTGPLSIYFNAAAFKFFGTGLRTLEFANLPILIATVILLYHLAAKLGNKLCATIVAISFLILFAFAHLTIAGNYNYVCPYEYEYTHGVLLSLLTVLFLARTISDHQSLRNAKQTLFSPLLAGLFTGLTFLTRTEFLAAVAGAAGLAFILVLTANWKRIFPTTALFIAGFLVPILASSLLLHLAMPMSMAIYRTSGMLPAVLRGNVASQRFYQHSMGLDDLGGSLRLMAAWTIAWAIPIAAFTAWALFRAKRRYPQAAVTAFLLGLLFAALQWRHRDWAGMFRPLPIIVAATLVVSLVQFFRNQHRDRAALAAILALFSLILMAKVFFYARIIHYGVWLAMPATIVALVALFAWIPAAIARREGNAAIFLAGIGGAWTVVLLVHLAITKNEIRPLDIPVGSGADRFLADSSRGNFVNTAILIAQQLPPGQTLACFPEGIMINYLARRPTATRYVNFNPPDLLLFGEERMLAAMSATPPDYIFIVHKDTKEFGERFFGQDYGQKLYAWIQSNYEETDLPNIDLGPQPLKDARFGIRLLIHRHNSEGEQRMIEGRVSDSLETAGVW